MKVKGHSGQYFFRALVSWGPELGWRLDDQFFDSAEMAASVYKNRPYLWPAEIIDEGTVYIPSESEVSE